MSVPCEETFLRLDTGKQDGFPNTESKFLTLFPGWPKPIGGRGEGGSQYLIKSRLHTVHSCETKSLRLIIQ